MKASKMIILSGVLALAGTAAYADEIPKFKDLDADGDKVLTEGEYSKVKDAGVKKTFTELDKNKDGKLSINEYSVILDEDCE